MPWRIALLFIALGFAARAQSPCDARCNQLASECLKRCVGDPKDASKPSEAKRLSACLVSCETQTKPCREACRP